MHLKLDMNQTELEEAGVTDPVVAPQVIQGEPPTEVRRFLKMFKG